MFIGKWNRSVILTYVGLIISCFGFWFCSKHQTTQACACLVAAGLCDLFDGLIARSIKRDKSEKLFGIQLDSLVDAVSFIALPIAIVFSDDLAQWYTVFIAAFFAICGVARLAYFNIEIAKPDKRVTHYRGLPVTFTALILPLIPALLCWKNSFGETLFIMQFVMIIIGILNIANVKIPKPKGLAYPIFLILGLFLTGFLFSL